MTTIQTVTSYRVEGKEFPTLGKVKSYLEDELGKTLENALQFRLTPKQASELNALLICHRERICSILGQTYVGCNDDWQTDDTRSIWDF